MLVVKTPEWTDDFGTKHPAELIPAKGFKANLREDTGEVLGIVSDDYEVVDNRDAFRFLDALIGSELHFETAGSLWGGRRVWCLARLPEYIELGGDLSATYVYVANSHDGSMARHRGGRRRSGSCAPTRSGRRCARPSTARTPSGHSASATPATSRPSSPRPARCSGMTIDYEKQFKALADRLALEPISETALERRVLRHLWVIDDDTGERRSGATASERSSTCSPSSAAAAAAGDTTGNSPGSKWVAFNAIAEHLDYGRRYTTRSNQVQRSFEDTSLKQRALELVVTA